MEEVRVCRFCGHIDPVQHTGKCEHCGSFTGFVICSRQEAEALSRERQRSRGRRGLRYGLLGLVLLAGVTAWVVYAIFDLGVDPPLATTRVSASVQPHTWAQVRRTPQNTGFTPDTAPSPQHIAWMYHTHKRLFASPAVVENHVYLTTEDGRTVALDRQSGQPVWTYPNGGPSSSTPAVAGNHVIVAMRTGRVVALERYTGEQRWQADFEKSILASPIVVDGTVYIGVGDWHLYALDAATGQQLWALATNDWVVAAVSYVDHRLIVSSQKSRVQVVDTHSGRERFLYDTGLGRHIVASAAIQGDRAYFGSRYGRVWAIDWRTNSYPLERALLLWKTNLFAWGLLSKPPVHKGTVWSKPVQGDVMHTAAIAHGMVYVTTSQGAVVAFDAETGAQRWVTKLDHDLTSAPTVAGDAVLIGTRDGTVMGLNAHTGAIQWHFKTEGEISASPIVAGETMYVASHDGRLYAVSSSE
ncbi:outer membrane protein assembly factor BamB family protein [Candidatus Entotheonella palauensis]|uniref:outer membrane protein assembly factor BamB family protein n=1 Tax=Candidatus Entotheonella palauensis TaxID=93172 RepID=UPI0015C4547D|nr:PQQ-binding-like beta-propeller repeat protein [Candidatus Entotheonella palauensis]